METRRWTNPTQPQTLQIAVFLLYANAAITFLFGLLGGSLFIPLVVILIAGGVAAGSGIANEHKWGYILGLVMAGFDVLLSLGSIVNLAFAVALVALLLHPQSRDYQRIWFR
jgi:hypothetical protein